MEIIKIDNSISNIKKIYHIADIHIRLYKRIEEYMDVFQSLYQEIKKDFTSESIIVIAGDLVHSKVEMSPEMINVASNFLTSLSEIGPTIIIPGNHDANLNNLNRLDAITPIVENLKNPNIIYLKKTGLYSIGDNVILSVMSVFDKIEEYILSKDIPDTTKTKIALYHGSIQGSTMDSGYKLKNCEAPLNLFDGYDIVIIGDIHMHQKLQDKSEGKPYIVYVSSLIQQNHGESINNHGMIIWDIKSRTYEFKEIKNKYGFVTLNIVDGKIIHNNIDIPEFPRIRLLIENTTSSELKECIIKLRHEYNPIEISLNRVGRNSILNDKKDVSFDISKIRDVAFQNILLNDYFKRHHKLNESVIVKILELNHRLNSKLLLEDSIRNVIYKLKSFEFSNMFSYGENNYINFDNMSGIVGLFAPNATGKSSLLNSIEFCLFDKSSIAYKASDIMNNQKDYFSCSANLEIGGELFSIEKKSKRSKDSANVKINFSKIESSGKEVQLNAESRASTQSAISSYIGKYDDFVLTAMSSQNNNNNFSDLGQADRKEMISRFMDTTVFDELHCIASEEIKEYSLKLKDFQKRDFDAELYKLNQEYKKIQIQESVTTKLKDSTGISKSKIVNEIQHLTGKLVKIESSTLDIVRIENMKLKKESELKSIEAEILRLNESISKRLEEFNLMSGQLKALKDENLDTYNIQHASLTDKLDSILKERDELKIYFKLKMDKVNKLKSLKYNPECQYCMDNEFIKDAIKAKSEINNDMIYVENLNKEKNEIELKLLELKPFVDKYNTISTIENKIHLMKVNCIQLNSEKSQMELKLNITTSEIAELSGKISLYYKSKEDIENNKRIEQKINNLESNLNLIEKEIKQIDSELIQISSKLLYLDNTKSSIELEISKFKEIEEQYDCYKYYIESVSKDGIPYELISNVLPIIESEANSILNQMVAFSIMLDLDGKNINAKLVYDENRIWPLELASGMEKFITSLAIRVALIHITTLPKPNFLIIDEGWSSIDPDNLSNIPAVLDYLKSNFEFILIISHMDFIRDFVDVSLNLEKSDNFSKLIYN